MRCCTNFDHFTKPRFKTHPVWPFLDAIASPTNYTLLGANSIAPISDFYWTPNTERGQVYKRKSCLFVCHHFFHLRIFSPFSFCGQVFPSPNIFLLFLLSVLLPLRWPKIFLCQKFSSFSFSIPLLLRWPNIHFLQIFSSFSFFILLLLR